MSDPYPNIDEFGAGACTCNGTMTGCAVCSTGNVLVRFKKAIPRLADGTPNMRELGRRMGARCRAKDGCRHGVSLSGSCTGGTNWCALCAYLELKANGVPVAYGHLTWAQIVGHAKARHPIILPGRYGVIPVVAESSYTSVLPARGRSDQGFGGSHMMVLWGVASLNSDGTPRAFIVSDSDFGSPARPTVPPHSVISAGALKSYWAAYGWSVCYALQAPPSLATTTALPFGAVKFNHARRARARVRCNQRSSPYIRSNNVTASVAAGTTIRFDRYTRAGTNVGGSSTWYGTTTGKWFHKSVIELLGWSAGKETIR